MTTLYGAARGTKLSEVRYTEAQLRIPNMITRILGMGLTIHALDTEERGARELTASEKEAVVNSVDDLQIELKSWQLGTPNGVADLSDKAKLSTPSLPDEIVEYLGTWDAENNVPLLLNGIGNRGDQYQVVGVAADNKFDFGDGDQKVEHGNLIEYRDGKWEVTEANGLTTEQVDGLANLMFNQVTPMFSKVPFAVSITKPNVESVLFEADGVVNREFVIQSDGNMSDVSIHPTAGVLTIKTENQDTGTFRVGVIVGNSLGHSEVATIAITVE